MLLTMLLLTLVIIAYVHHHFAAVPLLTEQPNKEPQRWPRLSVIVPACDEEMTIEPAMQTLLNQDYPNLEIIAVNDRSSDQTGALLDKLAATSPQLQVVHIEALPENWLGKVHALARGTERATGEFLLFTDADTHFEPGLLKRVLGWVNAESLDHVTLAPTLHASSLALGTSLACFTQLFLAQLRMADVAAGRESNPIGIGAFNLVRREVFVDTPGWEWLRLEIADDVGLGQMMAQRSDRTVFAFAGDALHIAWYRTVSELVHGLAKNAYPKMGHFNPIRTLGLIVVCPIAPAAFLYSFTTPLAGVSALIVLLTAVSARRLNQLGTAPLPTALAPLAVPLFSWILLNSMVRILREGGVRWRDTHYPTALLKANQRVQL